jgi:signal transduction histidine kinase
MATTRQTDGGSAVTGYSPPARGKVLGRGRRGLRARLKDTRIRVKLGLILIIPTVAVLVLATDRIVQLGQQAASIEQIRSLAALSTDASAVNQEIQHERMSAAQFLANTHAQSDQYLLQIRLTDQAIANYKSLRSGLGDVPTAVADRLQDIDQQLTTLEQTRQQVQVRSDLTVSAVVLRYGALAEDLVAFRESLGQIAGATTLGDTLRAAAALSRTKLQMSEAQAVAFVALQDGTLDDEQLTSFLSTLIGQQGSLDAFMLAATPDQRAFVSSTLTGDEVSLADDAANDVIRSTGRPALITPDDASKALGAEVDLIRWAEQQIDRDVQAAATAQRNSVIWQVVVEAGAVLLVIIFAFAFALMLARALIRSLNELRLGALNVAERDLPDTVARLSDRSTLGDHSPAEIAAQIADPIGLSSSDEIGDVARAFNVVHREAVRVAAEQATLRTGVSVMFLNLARRSQSLVDQMIAHLDDMERDEADAKRLARLFRLDHLATRMRRNDENLLVLAGADSSPARGEDSLLIDIMRAAQAEIENYGRIEFGSVDIDALVTARAVNDVVRLFAELLDNATRFSPPDVAVLVSARQLGDYLVIQIEDRGVGVSPDQVGFFNSRLAAPPTMDISAFRMMGLAVVGRLASRYDIQVELRSGLGEGTTVYIKLPGPIVLLRRAPQSYELQTAGPRSLGGGGGSYGSRQALAAPAAPPPPRWPAGAPAGMGSGPVAGRTPAPPQYHNGSGQYPGGPALSRPIAELPPVPRHPEWPSPPNDETAEMPIYREMEATWFRGNHSLPVVSPGSGGSEPSGWGEPRTPPPQQRGAATGSAPPRPPAPAGPPPPAPSRGGWQTSADSGWRAARSAAEQTVRTQTRTGLPKRVPQAQLVPGGVETGNATKVAQRTPDDVRGLLSAYHRGVQRGRGVDDRPVTE